MAEFVERTKTETGCIYYGWTKSGDKLFCREAYVDAAGALAHLENVGALVGKLLESAATLDQIKMHGFGTTYWEIDSGISFMKKEVTAERAPHTLMTIQPTFTVKDWAAAAPIMAEFVERTKTEKGCIYYGWSKSGNKLFCREAYVDAAGAIAHLDNVGALVGKLLESAATLDQIELHGPSAELDKCKEKMDAFGTTYWEIDSGISFMANEVTAERAPHTLMTIQPTFADKDGEGVHLLRVDQERQQALLPRSVCGRGGCD